MKDDEEYDELYSEDDDTEFDLGRGLDAPAAQLYTTKQLHTLIHEGAIDLNPPYQREVVWSEAKQCQLLDSIWRNYYVPPIVFTVYKDADGELVRCCIDGKQRLTSIQKFFDGQHWRTGKNWWYTTSNAHKNAKSRMEVPPKWKKDFASKTLTCVEYFNLPPHLERDIFQRVQLGTPLTAAEKLQAIASPRNEWITSDLQPRFIFRDDSLTQKIEVAIKRGQDFQLLAGLVYCCDEYPAQTQPNSRNLERWLMSRESPTEEFKTAMRDVLNAFWHIADNEDLNYGFKQIQKRVAPIEFTFTGVVLYILREYSYEDRAQAIYDMRTHIRKKFQDIRNRNDIVKELWNFVEMIVDGLDEPPQDMKPKKSKGKKARRAADDDDMDLDDEYHAPRKKSKKK
ncbi:hypothetical protein C8Q80DRAFT_1220396 [Daedaleopsis nitida]|nr:hypothetical protein C8Q80DRAFT_1220396 [Daedaleopsis nitida]